MIRCKHVLKYRHTSLCCGLHFLKKMFPFVGIFLHHIMYKKYTSRLTHVVVRILMNNSFHVARLRHSFAEFVPTSFEPWTPQIRATFPRNFEKSNIKLNILGTRNFSWIDFHTKDLQILGSAFQNWVSGDLAPRNLYTPAWACVFRYEDFECREL